MIEIRPQTIHSPSGDELVVLTRAEYDALSSAAAATLEEADDIAIFDARVADLTAGRDARLPPEVTTAMLRGNSLLRALRRWKGMKQLDLALGAKLVQGYVSDLESGRKGGTAEDPSRPRKSARRRSRLARRLSFRHRCPAFRRRPAAMTACGSRAVAKSARPRRSLRHPYL